MINPNIPYVKAEFRFQDKSYCFAQKLDSLILRPAFESIDYAAAGTDPFTAAVFCTAEDKKREITRDRELFIKEVSEAIAEALWRGIGSGDTENGYKIKTPLESDETSG